MKHVLWLFRSCPRCMGALYVAVGEEPTCISCGFVKYPEGLKIGVPVGHEPGRHNYPHKELVT